VNSDAINQLITMVLHESACGHFRCIRYVLLRGTRSGANNRLASMERAKRRWRGGWPLTSAPMESDGKHPLFGKSTRLGNQFACGLWRPGTVRLVASGRVRLKPTITHILSGIESVPKAFEITANKGAFKAINPAQVVMRPQSGGEG
jgi:hypothetical protein